MKQILLSISLGLALLLTGCSTPNLPSPTDEAPSVLQQFERMAEKTKQAGGLSSIGVCESKSMEIALNRAKAAARRELITTVETKLDSMQKAFIEEAGMEGEVLSEEPFRNARETITLDQLRNHPAKHLRYEFSNGMVTAYALMELNPGVLLDSLLKEDEFSEKFRQSAVYTDLVEQIGRYDTMTGSTGQ
jgi:hypothetical protein